LSYGRPTSEKREQQSFLNTELIFEKMVADRSGHMQVCEDQALYEVKSARKSLE
jgi:site-specific DNA-methyltransferase (adenine-specific)